MTSNLRPASPKKLKQLYLERDMATQRLQMAVQTVTGAQEAYIRAEVAFLAAARATHGPDATYEWDVAKRRLTFKQPLPPPATPRKRHK